MNLFQFFRKTYKKQNPENNPKTEFECLMEFTKPPAGDEMHYDDYRMSLIEMVRLIGRSVQCEHMLRTATTLSPVASGYNVENSWFDPQSILSRHQNTFQSSLINIESERHLYLGKDLILPSPWSREKLMYALGQIGIGKLKGPWKKSNDNHDVNYFLPIGIGFVGRGHHSFTSGILQAEGIVKPNVVYDMRKVYDYVYCDGMNYLRTEDNSIISPVKDYRMAAIFEIGRLMVEHNVSA